MAQGQGQGHVHGHGTDGAPGQDRTFEVTNPATGEKRTVTQRQWREQQLGRAGFQKPADMPDEDEGGTQATT